jgi:hypothetical protein
LGGQISGGNHNDGFLFLWKQDRGQALIIYFLLIEITRDNSGCLYNEKLKCEWKGNSETKKWIKGSISDAYSSLEDTALGPYFFFNLLNVELSACR